MTNEQTKLLRVLDNAITPEPTRRPTPKGVVARLERLLDSLEPGAAAKVQDTTMLGRIDGLAAAIASAVKPREPIASAPTIRTKATLPATESAFATYNRLIAEGRHREAGAFYADHADEIYASRNTRAETAAPRSSATPAQPSMKSTGITGGWAPSFEHVDEFDRLHAQGQHLEAGMYWEDHRELITKEANRREMLQRQAKKH